MKFIADINITQTVIKNLKQEGHDVLDIKKQNPRISDIELVKLAQRQGRIILTHDKDFEYLTTISKYQVGVIAIRLKTQTVQHHFIKLNELLSGKTQAVLNKSLTIITEESIELREFH